MNTKKRESEEWPAEYTDETGRRRSSFNHETHERHERRREEGDRRSCPRITRRGANGGEGDSEEWPAGYTDDTERGTEIGTTETEKDFLTTKDTKGGGRIVGRGREREKILARVGGGPSVARS